MPMTLIAMGAFALTAALAWFALTLISQRNSQAEERLDRIGRPKSLAEIEIANQKEKEKFSGLKSAMQGLGAALEPQNDLEKNKLKLQLANAGFRSETAPSIFQGLRLLTMAVFVVPTYVGTAAAYGAMNENTLLFTALAFCLGFFLPTFGLWYLRTSRQQAIFLSLPDALDLMVVCVESGLGLDAAMRRVADEMKGHAKIICEEFALANLQLQMGRPRREVLHDLGVRTGVDDVKALAAILIQADRFGSSIAQALRVQSDSMRTRRRQIAEEKAAKTAVQLIFPLVLFIFPGIFVVLVGPAAIQISNILLKK
jgi:tight adherence protein C